MMTNIACDWPDGQVGTCGDPAPFVIYEAVAGSSPSVTVSVTGSGLRVCPEHLAVAVEREPLSVVEYLPEREPLTWLA